MVRNKLSVYRGFLEFFFIVFSFFNNFSRVIFWVKGKSERRSFVFVLFGMGVFVFFYIFFMCGINIIVKMYF